MPAYLCNRCDRIAQRPAAGACGACSASLVEVDVSLDILACPTCDHYEAGTFAPDYRVTARCPSCKKRLKRINRAEATDATGRRVPQINPPPRWMLHLGGVILGLQANSALALIAAAVFGVGVPYGVKAAAVLVVPVILVVLWTTGRALWRQIGDPRVRANHSIEHAAIAILEKEGREMRWGHSGQSGFWVSGDVSRGDVERAAAAAIERLRGGDPDLRIHPCCGGRFLVDHLVTAAATVLVPASILVTILRPRLWPTLGIAPLLWLLRGTFTSLLQRFGTTTAKFKEARVDSVKRREDAYFVGTTLTF